MALKNDAVITQSSLQNLHSDHHFKRHLYIILAASQLMVTVNIHPKFHYDIF